MERYTEKAKEALSLAEEAAQDLGTGTIGTEHILSALLGEADCVAVRILSSIGVSCEDLKNDLNKFFENIDHILTAAAAHFNSNQLNMGIEPLRVQFNGFIKMFAGLIQIFSKSAPTLLRNGI